MQICPWSFARPRRRWPELAPGLVLLLLGCATALGEQPTSKWLGIQTPEEQRAARLKMLRTPYYDLGLGPLELTGPGAKDYPDIRGEKLHRWLEDFVGFSEESRREGNVLWGRITGTPAQHHTAEYFQKKFQEFGLRDVHMDQFTRVGQWWPTRSRLSVSLKEPSGKRSEYVFRSAFPSVASLSAPGGAIEAEAVDVGLGREVDLAGRDVRGKIAVLHVFPIVGPLPIRFTGYGVPRELAAKGATGVITVIDLPGNTQTLAFQTNPETAPGFSVGNEDGEFLESLIGRARPTDELRVRMELTVEIKQGWTTENVYALSPGTTGEYTTVSAHQDCWFDGAADNASGLATLLALAEHFAHTPHSRNMLFIATAGHHMGGPMIGKETAPPPGSPGTHYFIEHYPEIIKKTALAVNLEHTASIARQTGGPYNSPAQAFDERTNTENPRVFAVSNRSPLLLDFAREAINRFGVTVDLHTDHIPHGDAAELGAIVPTVSMVEANIWYHTSADTADLVPPQGLERSARAFAYIIDKADRAPRADLERGAAPFTSLH